MLSFSVRDGLIHVDFMLKVTTFTKVEEAYDFIADASYDLAFRRFGLLFNFLAASKQRTAA